MCVSWSPIDRVTVTESEHRICALRKMKFCLGLDAKAIGSQDPQGGKCHCSFPLLFGNTLSAMQKPVLSSVTHCLHVAAAAEFASSLTNKKSRSCWFPLSMTKSFCIWFETNEGMWCWLNSVINFRW